MTGKRESAESPRIVVVGSANMDLVVRVESLPRPGETVAGSEWWQVPGGKGANQAVAAARLGAHCQLLGRVGADDFGFALRRSLEQAGVDTSRLLVTDGVATGVALISVAASGENSIAIVAGANGRLAVRDIESQAEAIQSAEAMLVQLEVPQETVAAALQVARRAGVLTVLDPAPVPRGGLLDALYQVDVLTPNETEAEWLAGRPVGDLTAAEEVARLLQRRGPRQVVLKLGQRGAMLCDEAGRCEHVPAPRVPRVVDTTAAGDAFTAALAAALVAGRGLIEATGYACRAGAAAVMRAGAQPSMPTPADVEAAGRLA